MDRTDAALVLGAVAIVPGIYSTALPPAASVAVMPDDDGNQAEALRTATLAALGLVAAVAVLTRTPAVAVLGGAAVAVHHLSYARAVGLPFTDPR